MTDIHENTQPKTIIIEEYSFDDNSPEYVTSVTVYPAANAEGCGAGWSLDDGLDFLNQIGC